MGFDVLQLLQALKMIGTLTGTLSSIKGIVLCGFYPSRDRSDMKRTLHYQIGGFETNCVRANASKN